MNNPHKCEGFVSLPIVCIGGLALLLVVASSSTMLAKKGRQLQPQDVENRTNVKNETRSFQLASQEKRGELLVLKMRNVSGKGITAYSVSTQPNGRQDTDYAISGHLIKPGEIEEIEIPLTSLDTINSSRAKEAQVRILAVLFDDKTSEGDPVIAAMIREVRLGKKIQLRRINRIIREALKSRDVSTVLGTLKSSIASLSEEPDRGQSSYVHSGLHDAKVDILTLIERLEQSQSAKSMSVLAETDGRRLLQEGLTKLIQESEKWVDRY